MCLFESHTTLVMAGDSVTDVGRTRPIAENRKEDLGRGYPAVVDALLTACRPDLQMRIINTGISGNTSRDLLERWDEDVLSHHPDYVSCMIGVNDIWRQFDNPHIPHRHVSFDSFMKNYEQMISRTMPQVKGMLVISCCYMEPNHEEPFRAMVDKYNAGAKELCDKSGAIYVDAMAEFDKGMKYNHPCFYTWDHVHPQLGGHMVIAKAFMKAAGISMDDQEPI